MTTPAFRLLRLPAKSLTTTLHCMDMIQLICLSLCSKCTKTAVKAMNLETTDLQVTVLEKKLLVDFKSSDLVPYEFSVTYMSLEGLPWSVLIFEPLEEYDESGANIEKAVVFPNHKLRFTPRDYLCHLMDILNKSTIDIEENGGEYGFSENALKNLFKNIDIREVICNSSRPPNNVLKYASSHAKYLVICSLVLPCLHQLFCSNFERLTMQTPIRRLELLLNFNSCLVDIENILLTEKDLNLFLKHWILGLGNTNFKRLRGRRVNPIDNLYDLLNGIHYQEQPESRIKTFWFEDHIETYHGGYDIERNDGDKTTLYIRELNPSILVLLYCNIL